MSDKQIGNVLDNFRELFVKDFNDKLNEFNNVEKEHDGVYMFFSFDIVNSTSFKEKCEDKWRSVISKFYDISEKTMNTIIEDERYPIEVWKYIGDEILFYKKVSSRKELFGNIRNAYQAQELIYENLCNINEMKTNINIKTSIWVAKCSEKESDSKNEVYISCQNNEYNEKYGARMIQIDFLGPDIDAGFRISKHVERGKVVISAKLACLLYKTMINDKKNEIFNSEEKMMIKSCIKIVAYEQLKGIWNNRYYPIVWYHHEWDKPLKMFEYDDYFVSKVAQNIFKNNNKFEKVIYSLEILPKIYNDLNKEDDIDVIMEYLKNIEDGSIKRDRVKSRSIRKNYVNSEVHCAAICFSNEDEIFIAKRSNSRKRYKDAWEFGGGKINSNETWVECLTKEYNENFKLDLKFDNNPIPIAIYELEKGDIIIPGLILIADVEKKEESFNKDKYSEVKWIKIEDINRFLKNEKTVNNMVDSINKAIELRKNNKA